MITIWIPLFVMLLGAIVYLVAAPAKPAELARITFWVGLFFVVWWSTGHIALR